MKESKLLGTLLPSLPEFTLIEEKLRGKYSLPEINPDDEPITEIYTGDEIISLDDFHKEIEKLVREDLSFLPPQFLITYLSAKSFSKSLYQENQNQFEFLPDDLKKGFEASLKFVEIIAKLIIQMVDPLIDSVVNMIYLHILTGETQEAPNHWIGAVSTIRIFDIPMVMAIAGQVANPDVIVQEFRKEYKKAFGYYRPRVTNTVTSTAYYLGLKLQGKPWNYIVEEYIRRNKFSLPRDRSSKRYQDTWRLYSQRLKKRIQRTQGILEVITKGDKKE